MLLFTSWENYVTCIYSCYMWFTMCLQWASTLFLHSEGHVFQIPDTVFVFVPDTGVCTGYRSPNSLCKINTHRYTHWNSVTLLWGVSDYLFDRVFLLCKPPITCTLVETDGFSSMCITGSIGWQRTTYNMTLLHCYVNYAAPVYSYADPVASSLLDTI